MTGNERAVRGSPPSGRFGSAVLLPAGVISALVRSLLVLSALVVWVPAAPPAGAHGGPAELQVVVVEPGPQSVRVEVRVVYVNDGHGVDDAAVTVAGESGGVQLTPVLLEPTGVEGTYAGVVGLPTPGTWTLRATSAEPTATQSFTAEVPAAGAPVPVTTAPVTTVPVSTVPVTTVDRSGSATDPGTDRTWIWVAAVGPLAAATAAAVGVTVALRRRRPASGPRAERAEG